MKDLYSKQEEERRTKFNNIINKIDMVLMNNIPEVDPSVYDNFDDSDPMDNCDVIDIDNADRQIQIDHGDTYNFWCQEHEEPTEFNDSCDRRGEGAEVYQWFAVNQSDAEYLGRHNQHITYSDMLDTYVLAITHFGTAWDYTSMVDDFVEPVKEATK